MKTMTMPVSDCGCFVGGVLDDDTISSFRSHEPNLPKFGIVIWYESQEAIQAAMKAVSDAHWPDPH